MSLQWGDPDQPPIFDTAELQHELTRFGPTRRGARPPVIHRAGDVARVRAAGQRLNPPRPIRAPGLDRRPDPATSLAWVAAFLWIVLAVAAGVLGLIVVESARHWLGIGQLVLVLAGWWGLTHMLDESIARLRRRHR